MSLMFFALLSTTLSIRCKPCPPGKMCPAVCIPIEEDYKPPITHMKCKPCPPGRICPAVCIPIDDELPFKRPEIVVPMKNRVCYPSRCTVSKSTGKKMCTRDCRSTPGITTYID